MFVVVVPLDVLRFMAACEAVGGGEAVGDDGDGRRAASSEGTALTRTLHSRGWLARARHAHRARRWWPSAMPLGLATTTLAPTSSTSASVDGRNSL